MSSHWSGLPCALVSRGSILTCKPMCRQAPSIPFFILYPLQTRLRPPPPRYISYSHAYIYKQTTAAAAAAAGVGSSSRRRLSSASSPSALLMASMDFSGVGAGAGSPEKDPRELDPALEGNAGDNYVKCGKCQACYPVNLEVQI